MTQGISVTIYPVKDLARAKAQFSALSGAQPYADSPYYVGFRFGDQEVGLDPNGHAKGMTGPVGYWPVADIKEHLQSLVGSGGQTVMEVTDVGGGKLIAIVKDPDGNLVGLTQNP